MGKNVAQSELGAADKDIDIRYQQVNPAGCTLDVCTCYCYTVLLHEQTGTYRTTTVLS